VEWQHYKALILDLAKSRSELGRLIATLTDDMDEGKKSISVLDLGDALDEELCFLVRINYLWIITMNFKS